MGRNVSTAAAAIASGQSLSGAVFLGDKVLCALQMSAGWDAADITFQVSDDQGLTWKDLLDASGSEIKISTPAAAKRLQLDPSDFASVQFLKVRSGISAAAVNQTAARSLTLISRKFYALD